jgi:hypothetical protein
MSLIAIIFALSSAIGATIVMIPFTAIASVNSDETMTNDIPSFQASALVMLLK